MLFYNQSLRNVHEKVQSITKATILILMIISFQMEIIQNQKRLK